MTPSALPPPAAADTDGLPLRESLRRVVVAWGFGIVWMQATSTNGAAFTQYAKLAGTGEFGFGLIAALPFLSALAQLPASLWTERSGRRKSIFLWTCTVHRLLWLGVAAIPWIHPGAVWWPALVASVLASAVLGQAAAPAWVAWMADLVPRRIRGRFFARRSQLTQAIGLGASLAVGAILDSAQAQGQQTLLAAVSGLFAVGAVFGAVDILLFLRIPDPVSPDPKPELRLADLVRAPLADRNFRRYLGFVGTLTFATGYIGPFLNLYLLDVARFGNFQINLMTFAIPVLGGLLLSPFWGRLVDRYGPKPVLLFAGLLIVNGSTAWLFVTPDSLPWGYLLVFVGIAGWPGIDVAGFNLVLGMSDSQNRGRSGSAAVALSNAVMATAGTLSGLFGGFVAHRLPDWRGEFLGLPLTYHGLLFSLSAVIRLLALGWLLGIEESRVGSVREGLRLVASGFYAELQQALLLPLRLAGRLRRQSYRLRGSGRWRRR